MDHIPNSTYVSFDDGGRIILWNIAGMTYFIL